VAPALAATTTHSDDDAIKAQQRDKWWHTGGSK